MKFGECTLIKDRINALSRAILVGASIIQGNGLPGFLKFRLAFDAVADAGHCLAAGFENRLPAFLAMSQAFAVRQPASCQLDRGFHRGVDLFLHRSVAGPANSHNLFPLFSLFNYKLIAENLHPFKTSFNWEF